MFGRVSSHVDPSKVPSFITESQIVDRVTSLSLQDHVAAGKKIFTYTDG